MEILLGKVFGQLKMFKVLQNFYSVFNILLPVKINNSHSNLHFSVISFIFNIKLDLHIWVQAIIPRERLPENI